MSIAASMRSNLESSRVFGFRFSAMRRLVAVASSADTADPPLGVRWSGDCPNIGLLPSVVLPIHACVLWTLSM